MNNDNGRNNSTKENYATSSFQDDTSKIDRDEKSLNQQEENGNETVHSQIKNDNVPVTNNSKNEEIMIRAPKPNDDPVCKENLTGRSVEVEKELEDSSSSEAMDVDKDEGSDLENVEKEPEEKNTEVKFLSGCMITINIITIENIFF